MSVLPSDEPWIVTEEYFSMQIFDDEGRVCHLGMSGYVHRGQVGARLPAYLQTKHRRK